jgi:signal transduction histidine kinase
MGAYFPLYWHGTIAFTLPFILLLQALLSGLSPASLTNLTLSLFLMALLVPWRVYLILFGVGSSLAGLGFWVLCPDSFQGVSTDGVLLTSFTFLFAALMAFLFSRQREGTEYQAKQSLKAKAGAFAHDITTPLMTLDLKLHTIRTLLKEKKEIHTIEEHLAGIQQIVQGLYGLKRMALFDLRDIPDDSLFQQEHNLKDLIQQAIETFPTKGKPHLFQGQDALKSNILLKTNPFSFIAMLQNLFKNAVEAMEEAGMAHEAQKIKIAVKKTSKRLEIQISDTGPGMTAEEIERALQPFYTTKETGTGLGLHTARQTLAHSRYHDHPGTLAITSKPNQGTLIHLSFG